jgi:hypothetical protein
VGITVGGTDPDGDIVTVLVLAPAYGKFTWQSELKGDGNGMWVNVTYEPPDRCWTGRDWFEFVVCDAHGNTARRRVQINVVNHPPRVPAAILQRTVVADEPNTIRLPAASDPDPGDQEALQYEVDHLPEARSWEVELPLLTVVPYRTCFPIVIAYRVRDRCGAEGGGIVVLWVLHRPAVHAPASPLRVHCGRSVEFSVQVFDQDFLCEAVRTIVGEVGEEDDVPFEYEERVTLSVRAVSGSPATIFPKFLSKDETCTVTYTPNPGVFRDELVITAVDVAGLSTAVSVRLTVDRPPDPIAVPPLVDVRPGEAVRVSLSARDPTVTVTQTAGPGAIIGNTYTWTVPDPYWGPSWRLVGFALTDPCGGKSHQHFVVRVLQPPRAYDGHVTARRGETARASVHVQDPDTPPRNLAFSFTAPEGLSVHLIGVEDPPHFYGSYFGYTARVEVTADRALCPGSYAVPFTVTDPDRNSARATLTVHVRGNEPPQASPPYLRGETTVILTPAGAVYGPVVMTVPRIWDPDGDVVYVEGYGLPPAYAASVSLFLGSLVAVYWPDAADGFCRAVRERDAIVDEFTVILRDACGARTEIPATVTIKVEDKVPPNLVYPARDRTVECDGQGNTAALSSWLAIHGGAWATDNCWPTITWTNDYRPERFVRTCGNAGYVTVNLKAAKPGDREGLDWGGVR